MKTLPVETDGEEEEEEKKKKMMEEPEFDISKISRGGDAYFCR